MKDEPIFEVRANDAPDKTAFMIFADGRITGFPDNMTIIINRIPIIINREIGMALEMSNRRIV